MTDDKPKFATGGIIPPGQSPTVGENRYCHPFGLLGDGSKLRELMTATDPGVFWPGEPPTGYLGIHVAKPQPAASLSLDDIRAMYEKLTPVRERPDAYRVNPATLDTLPRHQSALPWQDPTMHPLLGWSVIPDATVPVGQFRPVWPENPAVINAGGRAPSNPDSSPRNPAETITGPHGDYDKKGPVIGCRRAALILTASVLAMAVTLAAAGFAIYWAAGRWW